jgi:hypothetical protein
MSLSNLSSIASSNALYDFTNMTSKQAISAGGDLARKGVLTGDQFAVLAGDTTALSSTPIGGNKAGGVDLLNSTSQSNYFSVIQDSINYMKSVPNKDQAEMNGLQTSESLLAALNQYQYGSTSGVQLSGTSLNELA